MFVLRPIAQGGIDYILIKETGKLEKVDAAFTDGSKDLILKVFPCTYYRTGDYDILSENELKKHKITQYKPDEMNPEVKRLWTDRFMYDARNLFEEFLRNNDTGVDQFIEEEKYKDLISKLEQLVK